MRQYHIYVNRAHSIRVRVGVLWLETTDKENERRRMKKRERERSVCVCVYAFAGIYLGICVFGLSTKVWSRSMNANINE